MPVDLTPEEREFARRFIARRERANRQWRWARYFLLVVALVLLGLAALYGLLAVHLLYDALAIPESPEQGVTAIGMQGKLIDVIGGIRCYVVAMFWAPASTCLLIYVLAHWKRNVGSAILVKLLRAHLESVPEGKSSEPTADGSEEMRPLV